MGEQGIVFPGSYSLLSTFYHQGDISLETISQPGHVYFFRLLIFYVFTQLKQLPPRLQILLKLCPWRAPKTNAYCTFCQDVSTHYLFQSKKNV